MALNDMKAMLRHANDNGYAIGSFIDVDLNFITGMIKATERWESHG